MPVAKHVGAVAFLLIMLSLAAVAIYILQGNNSRYPDIYSDNTDGPNFLSFTLTDGILDYFA